VEVPHRAYWLFRGPLSGIGRWDTAEAWPGHSRLDAAQPAFVWPADHAWCVALDVDPHWAGIGGGTRLIDQLVADPLLDVVAADPTRKQPWYR
jgi:GNAT superfamily N-acetyltransferase